MADYPPSPESWIGDGIENQINLSTKEKLVELGISLNWAIIKRLNK